jgi:hypothetical protein
LEARQVAIAAVAWSASQPRIFRRVFTAGQHILRPQSLFFAGGSQRFSAAALIDSQFAKQCQQRRIFDQPIGNTAVEINVFHGGPLPQAGVIEIRNARWTMQVRILE